MFIAANKAMIRAFPALQLVSNAGPAEIRAPDGGQGDLDSVYSTALSIMNAQPSDKEDAHVVEVAINGALASLDPHSGYLNAAAYRDMQTQTRGSFGGIGAEVTMTDGLLKVVAPIDDSPAMRAGIRANDVIVSIDDLPVQGMTINQAVEKMRGPVNSHLRLKIVRPNVENPLEVTLVRDTIHVRAVRWQVEGKDIGYVRITTFNEQSEPGFRQATGEISRRVANDNLKGYILDLRNNPGGLLNEAVAVTDDLLERGTIVSTRGRMASVNPHFSAKPGDISKGKRIIVLINGGTASGSEIVAGALRDNKRATLLGSSFGKGSVQSIFPLGPDQGALRLTTARYYTPSGTSIQAKGIAPDIEVLQDEPKTANKRAPIGEATLSGHLPGRGAEQVASNPQDPKDDKAIIAAANLLRNGSSRSSR